MVRAQGAGGGPQGSGAVGRGGGQEALGTARADGTAAAAAAEGAAAAAVTFRHFVINCVDGPCTESKMCSNHSFLISRGGRK